MRNILPAFLVLAMSLPLLAQTIINGSEHPELIPDDAAARAIFNVHSMYATLADQTNTERHHAKLKFSASDHSIYDAAMGLFSTDVSTRGATLAALLMALSPDGQAKLKAFVQAEKKNMQYVTGQAVRQ